MKTSRRIQLVLVAVLSTICVSLILVSPHTDAQKPQSSGQQQSSYMSVNEEPFDVVRTRDKANKASVMAAQQRLLEARYNLARRVDENVRMTRGKPIPVGPTEERRHLGAARPHVTGGDKGQRTVSLFASAPCEPSGWRHGLSADRDQSAAKT